MELDFSRTWRIVPARPDPEPAGSPFPDPAATKDSADFAAAELSAVLGRMTGVAGGGAPARGDGSGNAHAIVLHVGSPKDGVRPSRAVPFSWRAEPERVEIYGETEAGLVRGIYDFLDALGARWVEPGSGGERLPSGTRLELAAASRRSPEGECAATLIVGHGAYLVRWADYLPWAARSGYSAVFVHTTRDALAFGAVPERLYERLRGEIAPAARRLGLSIELGGHLLSSFLPRNLFKSEPGLFRVRGGERSPDGNFCVSNPRALRIAADNFAAFALAYPEVEVFHAWPDDLPGGGWCSCPDCAALSPAAQSLKAARALAAALAEVRPAAGSEAAGDCSPARLSFLAYHDTEDVSRLDLSELPSNLEFLWAPRRRCWSHGLDDADRGEDFCDLNAASSAAYRAAASAWNAGGGGTSVFEYWEDAVLFKGAVPPLPRTIAGDLAIYAGETPRGRAKAESVGILLTGGRLPLAPRPNPWLMPRLLRRAAEPGEPRSRAEAELTDWVRATYGPTAEPMGRYWRALEAAWAIDLELEPGDTETQAPPTRGIDVDDPPADWGDPWTASPERLAERRDRCDQLFSRLRDAEAALADALALTKEGAAALADALALSKEGAAARAVAAESLEYAVAGNLLELDCARLAAYHERAAGQTKTAADIALLAQAPYSALFRAFGAVPDRRSRREMRLLLYASHGLRLRAIKRRAQANPLGRFLGRSFALAELGFRALAVRRGWERP